MRRWAGRKRRQGAFVLVATALLLLVGCGDDLPQHSESEVDRTALVVFPGAIRTSDHWIDAIDVQTLDAGPIKEDAHLTASFEVTGLHTTGEVLSWVTDQLVGLGWTADTKWTLRQHFNRTVGSNRDEIQVCVSFSGDPPPGVELSDVPASSYVIIYLP